MTWHNPFVNLLTTTGFVAAFVARTTFPRRKNHRGPGPAGTECPRPPQGRWRYTACAFEEEDRQGYTEPTEVHILGFNGSRQPSPGRRHNPKVI